MTMPSSRGNPSNVLYNPGAIYVAPIGTTEPTDLTTAWGTGWAFVGYTDAGSQFDYQLQTAEIKVEEELDPIAVVPISRKMFVRFAMAEIVATRLEIAMNGGTLTPAAAPAAAYYEPPDLGQEVRVMVGYESEDSTIRGIFRRCLSNGNISMQFKRAPQKAVLPVELTLERVVGSLRPFRFLLTTARAM